MTGLLHNQSMNHDFFITRKGAKAQRVVVYFSKKFKFILRYALRVRCALLQRLNLYMGNGQDAHSNTVGLRPKIKICRLG